MSDSLQPHDHKARLPSLVISQSLLKFKSIESGMHKSTFTARGLKLYLGNPDEKGLTSLAWFTESEHDAINSAARNVQITLSPTDAWNPTTANRAAARWRKTVVCVCVCVCVCVSVCVGGGAVK